MKTEILELSPAQVKSARSELYKYLASIVVLVSIPMYMMREIFSDLANRENMTMAVFVGTLSLVLLLHALRVLLDARYSGGYTTRFVLAPNGITRVLPRGHASTRLWNDLAGVDFTGARLYFRENPPLPLRFGPLRSGSMTSAQLRVILSYADVRFLRLYDDYSSSKPSATERKNARRIWFVLLILGIAIYGGAIRSGLPFVVSLFGVLVFVFAGGFWMWRRLWYLRWRINRRARHLYSSHRGTRSDS